MLGRRFDHAGHGEVSVTYTGWDYAKSRAEGDSGWDFTRRAIPIGLNKRGHVCLEFIAENDTSFGELNKSHIGLKLSVK